MKINKKNNMFNLTYLGVFLIPFEYLIESKIYAIILISISIYEALFLLRKNSRFPVTYFTCGYFMLIVYGFVSCYYTKDTTSTYSILIQIIPYYIFIFMVSWCILLEKFSMYEKIESYLKVFLYGTLSVAIYTVIVDLKDFNIYTKVGMKVFGGQQTMFTYYLIISVCIGIFLFTSEKDNMRRYWYLIAVIVLYGIGLFTSVRKAIIIPIVFCIAYIFIESFNYKKIFKGMLIIFLLFISLLVLYNILMKNEHFAITVGSRLRTFVIGIMGGEVTENSFNTREALRNTSWKCFKENPLFGYGFGAFRDYSDINTGIRLYAHNNFLELLASCGIFGFSIYYGCIVLMLKKLINGARENKNQIYSFGIAFILAMFINDYGTVSYLSISFIIMLTIISCSTKIKIIENDE